MRQQIKNALIAVLIFCIICYSAISRAETMWVCEKCSTVNKGNYCTECGAKSPEWICSNCGAVNVSKFCSECGTSKENSINSNPHYLAYEGYSEYNDGNYSEAAELYAQAFILDNINYEYAHSALVAYYNANEIDNAVNMAIICINLKPEDAEPYRELLSIFANDLMPERVTEYLTQGYKLTKDQYLNPKKWQKNTDVENKSSTQSKTGSGFFTRSDNETSDEPINSVVDSQLAFDGEKGIYYTEISDGQHVISWDTESAKDFIITIYSEDGNQIYQEENTDISSFDFKTASMTDGALYEIRVSMIPQEGSTEDAFNQSIFVRLNSLSLSFDNSNIDNTTNDDSANLAPQNSSTKNAFNSSLFETLNSLTYIGFSGLSMYDTINDGDVIGYITTNDYKRDDIVICKFPNNGNSLCVKRIVAVPGDIVGRKDKISYVIYTENGETVEDVLDDPDLADSLYYATSGDDYSYTLGENEFFLVGDNRFNSHDSRNWKDEDPSEDVGPISRDLLIGKVISCIAADGTVRF